MNRIDGRVLGEVGHGLFGDVSPVVVQHHADGGLVWGVFIQLLEQCNEPDAAMTVNCSPRLCASGCLRIVAIMFDPPLQFERSSRSRSNTTLAVET